MHVEEYSIELIIEGYRAFCLFVCLSWSNCSFNDKFVVYILKQFFHWLKNFIVLTLSFNFLHFPVLCKCEEISITVERFLFAIILFVLPSPFYSYLHFIIPVMSGKYWHSVGQLALGLILLRCFLSPFVLFQHLSNRNNAFID